MLLTAYVVFHWTTFILTLKRATSSCTPLRMNVLPKLPIDVCTRLSLHRDPVPLSLVMSKSMHTYNALYFLQHTCTKKLMSLCGYCVPVKCCMFLVSRITGCHEADFQGFLDF